MQPGLVIPDLTWCDCSLPLPDSIQSFLYHSICVFLHPPTGKLLELTFTYLLNRSVIHFLTSLIHSFIYSFNKHLVSTILQGAGFGRFKDDLTSLYKYIYTFVWVQWMFFKWRQSFLYVLSNINWGKLAVDCSTILPWKGFFWGKALSQIQFLKIQMKKDCSVNHWQRQMGKARKICE